MNRFNTIAWAFRDAYIHCLLRGDDMRPLLPSVRKCLNKHFKEL